MQNIWTGKSEHQLPLGGLLFDYQREQHFTRNLSLWVWYYMHTLPSQKHKWSVTKNENKFKNKLCVIFSHVIKYFRFSYKIFVSPKHVEKYRISFLSFHSVYDRALYPNVFISWTKPSFVEAVIISPFFFSFFLLFFSAGDKTHSIVHARHVLHC